MAVLPIVTGSSIPVLRTPAERIPQVTKEIKKLIKDMQETVVSAQGVGLAAPQVDRSLRLCLCMINGKMTPLINPEITWKSDEKVTDEEGCLSLPKTYLQVPRSREITLNFLDENGQPQQRRLADFDARVVQHEVDHLDGILIVDYRHGGSLLERAESKAM